MKHHGDTPQHVLVTPHFSVLAGNNQLRLWRRMCVSVLNVLWVIDHLVGHGGKHKLRDKGLERP